MSRVECRFRAFLCIASLLPLCLVGTTAADDDDARARQQFMGWFAERGGRANASLDVFGAMGTGVRVRAAVAEGEPVLVVPLSSVVCRETLAGPGSLDAQREIYAGVASDDDLIVAFLLAEAAAGEASLWAPYVAVLPRDVDFLAAWTERELAELQARVRHNVGRGLA